MTKNAIEFKRAHFDKSELPFTKASKARGNRERNHYLTCDKCGMIHLEECLVGQEGCFECGEVGHKRRDCLIVARRGRERA